MTGQDPKDSDNNPEGAVAAARRGKAVGAAAKSEDRETARVDGVAPIQPKRVTIENGGTAITDKIESRNGRMMHILLASGSNTGAGFDFIAARYIADQCSTEGLYTQEEVDQLVAQAVAEAAKDEIIAQKDQTSCRPKPRS